MELGKKSRGEIFVEQALQARSSSSQEQHKAPPKTRKKKDKPSLKSTEPRCYGCGAHLQTSDSAAPGYVPWDIFETKKKHHQLKTVLCGRCRSLTHGEMIPAVGGHGGYGGGKRFVSAEQLRAQLSHLCNEKALIIKLVDIVDFNGSFLARIRDLVGANPIILVATKIDLLPRGTDLNAVGDWIVEFISRKRLNVISVHMTSAKSLLGIAGIVSYLKQHRQGRNVYILGSANVGKSAFVSAILQHLSLRDPIATAALRHMPIQSAMPGTTLGPIEIEAFSGGGSLFDTPGIHVHHRMAAVVPPEDLPFLAPRRRLRGYPVSQLISERNAKTSAAFNRSRHMLSSEMKNDKGLDYDSHSNRETNSFGMVSDEAESMNGRVSSLSGRSIFWGGIVRLDLVKVPPNVSLRLYGPTAVPMYAVLTSEADIFYKEELAGRLTPPSSAKGWSGLQSQHTLKLRVESWNRPTCDIAISGLGWVTIEAGQGGDNENSGTQTIDGSESEVEIVIFMPKAVEAFVRSPIPVGFQGSEWYDYRELTENELEARPTVFCP